MSAHLTSRFDDTRSQIKKLKDDIKQGLLAAFTAYYINERHKMVKARGQALQAYFTGITLPANTGSLFSKPKCDFSSATTWSGNNRPDDLENLFLNYEALILACDNESGGPGKSSFAKLVQKTVGHLIPPKGAHRMIWISAEKSCQAARMLTQEKADTSETEPDNGSDGEWVAERTTTFHGQAPAMPQGGFSSSYAPATYAEYPHPAGPGGYGAPLPAAHLGYPHPAGPGGYGSPPPVAYATLVYQQQQQLAPAPWGAPIASTRQVVRTSSRRNSASSTGSRESTRRSRSSRHPSA